MIGRIVAGAAAAIAFTLAYPAAQAPAGGVQDPSWSPDGKLIAVSFLDRVWTITPEGRQAKRLTSDDVALERDPAWSADGARIAFASIRDDGPSNHLRLAAMRRRSRARAPLRLRSLCLGPAARRRGRQTAAR